MNKVAEKPDAVEEKPKHKSHEAEPEAEKPAVDPVVGKTVASVKTTHHGSMFVVDMAFTDESHHFIKTRQGALEVGGTADWDTGTKM